LRRDLDRRDVSTTNADGFSPNLPTAASPHLGPHFAVDSGYERPNALFRAASQMALRSGHGPAAEVLSPVRLTGLPRVSIEPPAIPLSQKKAERGETDNCQEFSASVVMVGIPLEQNLNPVALEYANNGQNPSKAGQGRFYRD